MGYNNKNGRSNQWLWVVIFWAVAKEAGALSYVNLAGDVPCGRKKLSSPPTMRQGKAINADESYRGEFPWMVSFRWSNNGEHFCGGSIIHRRYILSAAHCFVKFTAKMSPYPYRWMEVTVGESVLSPNVENAAVEEIWVHPEFNASDFSNDIAVVKLTQEIGWSVFKQPVCLPNPSSSALHAKDEDVGDDDDRTADVDNSSSKLLQEEETLSVQIAGWGATMDGKNEKTSNVLRKTNISPIYKNEECQKAFPMSSFHVTVNHLCAGGGSGVSTTDKLASDACYGDSGGPLMTSGRFDDGRGNVTVAIGIISASVGCAKYPGIYSRVSSYIPWIRLHINDENERLNEIW